MADHQAASSRAYADGQPSVVQEWAKKQEINKIGLNAGYDLTRLTGAIANNKASVEALHLCVAIARVLGNEGLLCELRESAVRQAMEHAKYAGCGVQLVSASRT
jgi:hypothetical protein